MQPQKTKTTIPNNIKRCPFSSVLNISPKFFESERSIWSMKDIDTLCMLIILDACKDNP
jgi:hypothetical protein